MRSSTRPIREETLCAGRRGVLMAMSSLATLGPLVLASLTVALPSRLAACASASRAGRFGICAADGKPVVLRGANYIRLDSTQHYHSTFSLSDYNRTRFNGAMRDLAGKGFNINRVFIDHRASSGVGGLPGSRAPLDLKYIGRLAEYVDDAANFGLYTMVTLSWLPLNAYFANRTRHMPNRSSYNSQFLSSVGHAAWVEFCALFAAALSDALVARTATGGSVLFSLQNEFFLRGDEWPFDITDDSVSTAAGVFSMAATTERQQAADANTNAWADACRVALRARMPSSLVTVGVFTFHAVHKAGPSGLPAADCARAKDCRFPARPYWLSRSNLDVLDVHIYQAEGDNASLAANLQTEEWAGLRAEKPVIMGEFGCLGGVAGGGWYRDAHACAPHVAALQRTSCSFGFVGWLFWTYDTDDLQEQPQWFSMVDDGGAIETALAPNSRPDACAREP